MLVVMHNGSDLEDKIKKIEKKIPDISDLVKKSVLTAAENKIPDISGLATKSALTAAENKIPSLAKKTDFDSKITEVEGKIPNISSLVTNSALTTVENKIPDVTSLVTKTVSDAKLKAISDRVTNVDNELKK